MKAWLITFSIYNSRLPKRKVQYRNKSEQQSQPILLTTDEQHYIAKVLHTTARKHSLLLLRLAVLPDHVHMLVMADDKDKLSQVVHRLKGASAYYLNRRRKMPKGTHAWTKKYDFRSITDMKHLEKACKYIDNNHIKHAERWK